MDDVPFRNVLNLLYGTPNDQAREFCYYVNYDFGPRV